jgi:hypothetical protein
MMFPFGPDLAPVNHSPVRGKDRGQKIRGISGPSFDVSLPSAILQQYLESRLVARMDVNGSPEYALTWKHWDMPSGPPICALRASGRRTSDKGCTWWRTPDAMCGGAQEAEKRLAGGHALRLQDQVGLAGWPTPQVFDSTDCKSGNKEQRKAKGGCCNLREYVELAGWSTASARDWKDGRSNQHEKNARSLNEVAVHGLTPSQSSAGTGKPGGYQLNSAFSRWLQGFPPEWDEAAPAKMARTKSSVTRRRGEASGKCHGG